MHSLYPCPCNRTKGLRVRTPGIQLSFHTLISPGPTLLISPWARTSLPNKIDLHVAEQRLFLVAERKSQFGKYFPFSTWAHSESGLMINLQPCFPSIALLKRAKSRKPIPPSLFDLVSFSQRIQWSCDCQESFPTNNLTLPK